MDDPLSPVLSPSFPSLSYPSSSLSNSPASTDPLPDFDMSQYLAFGDLSPKLGAENDSMSNSADYGQSTTFAPINPFKDAGANALFNNAALDAGSSVSGQSGMGGGDSKLNEEALNDFLKSFNAANAAAATSFATQAPFASPMTTVAPSAAATGFVSSTASEAEQLWHTWYATALANAPAAPSVAADFIAPSSLESTFTASKPMAVAPAPAAAAPRKKSPTPTSVPSASERDADSEMDEHEHVDDLSDVAEEEYGVDEDEEDDSGDDADDASRSTKGRKRSAPTSSAAPKGRKKQAVVAASTSKTGKPAKRTVSSSSSSAMPSTSAKLAALTASGMALAATMTKDAASLGGGKLGLPPVPEWEDKPSAEEYKKLSSKEKRQLRNKISARNFRHRRKEYIETLEGEISARDVMITGLQTELGSLKNENVDLRKDMNQLREQWQLLISSVTTNNNTTASTASALGSAVSTAKAGIGFTGLQPTKEKMPLSPAVSNISVNEDVAMTPKRVSSPIRRPNLNKDLSNDKSRTHWGAGAMGAGFVGVHATFVPEFRFTTPDSLSSELTSPPLPPLVFSSSSSSSSASSTADPASPHSAALSPPAEADDAPCSSTTAGAPIMNMNPRLNKLTTSQAAQLSRFTAHLRGPTTGKGVHDDFLAGNPLNLGRSLVDEYRAQLWSKVRNNVAGAVKSSQSQSAAVPKDCDTNANANASALPINWPAGFRPAYFQSPTEAAFKIKRPTPTSATTLAGKENRDANPFSADPELDARLRDLTIAVKDAKNGEASTSNAVETAAAVSTGIWGKLVSAFSEAFGADQTTRGVQGSGTVQWQPEKVAAVVTGKAKLVVVPREKEVENEKEADVDALCMGVKAVDLGARKPARKGSL